MNTTQKADIISLIHEEKKRLGSYAKVAVRCGVNPGTISMIVNNQLDSVSDDMFVKIGEALGYDPMNWKVVETLNSTIIWSLVKDSKNNSLFAAISAKAGSGKTISLKSYEQSNRENGVFYILCREWARREFLTNLAQNLGISMTQSAYSNDDLLIEIVRFFNLRREAKPILIIDEADKLKAPAKRTIIFLYNECKGSLGCVIAGTDHLKIEMERDARYGKKGADELLSRFGRRFVNLPGATSRDLTSICEANGLKDEKKISEAWKECLPVKTFFRNRSLDVIEDLRRIERVIQREVIRQ